MQRLLLFSLFFISLRLMAQTGDIKGTVTTKDGKPAEFVNLVLM